MINANELRIGNLFYRINRANYIHLPIQIPIKILEINMFNVLSCLADENPAMMKTIPVISMSDLSPIPLTPEILEKCGFENWDKNKYSNDCICLSKNGEGFLYLANQRHVNVFYLHQLQNLYFALTGEELKPVTPLK